MLLTVLSFDLGFDGHTVPSIISKSSEVPYKLNILWLCIARRVHSFTHNIQLPSMSRHRNSRLPQRPRPNSVWLLRLIRIKFGNQPVLASINGGKEWDTNLVIA